MRSAGKVVLVSVFIVWVKSAKDFTHDSFYHNIREMSTLESRHPHTGPDLQGPQGADDVEALDHGLAYDMGDDGL